MNARTWIVGLLAAGALGGGGWWWWQQRAAADAPQLRTAKIERGTLTATVAASGTLAPTVQVQVSSQVSGQIREVLTDFNADVRKGQVLARIDPETFEYRVRQAEADLEAARAQVGVQQATLAARRSDLNRARINYEEALRDFDRKQDLVARNFISPAERDKARSVARALEQDVAAAAAQIDLGDAQVRNARSTVQQREAQLASTRVDLGRTVIRAPVDGVVIKRSIEPGQTVAVSLAAPELFLIAQNLRDMQVEVSIDEAEVARLRVGQRTTFTVDAFPGRNFEGTVMQVRKASKNEQNVITYTAVVSADNDQQSLLPGMTANVRIVTDVRNDALKVPNAALRFKPPGWSEAPKSAGLPAPLAAALSAWVPDAAAQGSAGGLQAYRERLDRELSPSDAQKARIDAAFAAARERFAAARDADEVERPKLMERNREAMRAQIAEALDPAQRKTFATINAEIDARRAAGGGGAPAAAAGSAAAAAGAAGASVASAIPKAGDPKAAPARPGEPAAPAAPAARPGEPRPAAGGGGGPGGQMAAFRQRLERDLALTDAQRGQLDGIFGGMRERFMALRDAPEGDRAKLSERLRADMRAQIGEILDPAQKKKYAEILVELAGRSVARGRVFVPGPDGKPVPLELRLGLSDGAFTEVIAVTGGGKLDAGDLVYVGVVGGPSAPGPATPARPAGPRL
ncbi:MAG: efflux RND transporter periplasmic adaptor subunit [Burkholderiales bacterium]